MAIVRLDLVFAALLDYHPAVHQYQRIVHIYKIQDTVQLIQHQEVVHTQSHQLTQKFVR